MATNYLGKILLWRWKLQIENVLEFRNILTASGVSHVAQWNIYLCQPDCMRQPFWVICNIESPTKLQISYIPSKHTEPNKTIKEKLMICFAVMKIVILSSILVLFRSGFHLKLSFLGAVKDCRCCSPFQEWTPDWVFSESGQHQSLMSSASTPWMSLRKKIVSP